VDDVVAVAGNGLEASEQVVDQVVKRDLDPTAGRFEG
jgi:hypothetical protein